MANLLKDMFNDDQPKGYGRLHFKNREEAELFLKRLKEVGEVKDMTVPMSLYKGSKNNKVPFQQLDATDFRNVMGHEFKIPAVKNSIEYHIRIEGGEQKYSCFIYPNSKEIVDFEIRLVKNSDTLKFKYNITPWNAKSLIGLIDQYVAFISFLNYMDQSILENKINEERKNSPLQNIIFTLLGYLRIYLKVYAVFKYLDITPDKEFFQSLEDEDLYSELQEEINILYWGVLKELPIRNEGRLEEFKATVRWENNKRKEEILNKEITVTAINVDQMILGSQPIELVRKLIFYNLIVKKFEGNEVVYGDVDSKPMFVVSTYALKDNNAKDNSGEADDLIEYKEQYREAKRISEYNKEEVKDTGDDLEKVLQAYELEYKKPDFSNLIFPL